MTQLTSYEPTGWLRDIRRLFDQQYAGFGDDASKVETGQWIPAVDIKEEDKYLLIHADLPGMDKDAINISIKDNTLSITGERKTQSQEKNENFSRVERVYGRFSRRFSLPDFVDATAIEASMKKGVLEIKVPKKEEAKSRLIEVKELD